MRMWNKEGTEVLVDKEQVDILVKSGWSLKEPEAEVKAKAKEVDDEPEVDGEEADGEEAKAPVKKPAAKRPVLKK